MNEFPQFMRNPVNAISSISQSKGVEGYVFEGADGSQMAFWQCNENGDSAEHLHDFDEYFVVIQGQYTLILGSEKIEVIAGHEYVIPKGIKHAGKFIAGTRTIHAFGGKRAKRRTEEKQTSQVVNSSDSFPKTAAEKPQRSRKQYTRKQGQYLAFISHYTKLNGCPPAEADMQKYFKTTPPTVHGMVVQLEKKGFIEKKANQPRSIRLLLPREELPDLE